MNESDEARIRKALASGVPVILGTGPNGETEYEVGVPRCMVTKILGPTIEVRCRKARHDDQDHDFPSEPPDFLPRTPASSVDRAVEHAKKAMSDAIIWSALARARQLRAELDGHEDPEGVMSKHLIDSYFEGVVEGLRRADQIWKATAASEEAKRR